MNHLPHPAGHQVHHGGAHLHGLRDWKKSWGQPGDWCHSTQKRQAQSCHQQSGKSDRMSSLVSIRFFQSCWICVSHSAISNSRECDGECGHHTFPDAHKRKLFLVHVPQRIICTFPMLAHRTGSRWKGVCVTYSSALISISLDMSLLSVPFSRFPQVLSSPTCPTSLCDCYFVRWQWTKPPVPPLTGVGCLADWLNRPKTQVTSPTCTVTWTRHTPINFPDSFQCRDDATIISAADPEVLYSGASCSSKQTAANRVPTISGSWGASFWKQRPELVDSRASIQATGANVERESVDSTVFRSPSKEKRDRDQNVVHSSRDSNLQKILGRKVDSAVRGEIMAQQRLYEAEAEVEARTWAKRNCDVAFRRSTRNLSLNDSRYNKQVDGQIRVKETKAACMESWNWEIDSSKYYRKRFWRTLLKKDYPLQSSTGQRIWRHPLRNTDLILPKRQGKETVKWKENRWIRQFLHLTSRVEVVCWIILVELILEVVWWIIREILLRNGILENFMTPWNFTAGKLTSRLGFVQEQRILRSQCTGSKKSRLRSQLTNLWHRDRLWREPISLTSICLMRWLRLHWKSFSTRRHISRNEQVSKSSELRIPTDSYEGDELLTWSMSISVQPDFFSSTRTFSFVRKKDYRMTMFKISTSDGIKHYWQQARCLQMWSWKDCRSQNYRIPFNFGLWWHCMIKKLLETLGHQTVSN